MSVHPDPRSRSTSITAVPVSTQMRATLAPVITRNPCLNLSDHDPEVC